MLVGTWEISGCEGQTSALKNPSWFLLLSRLHWPNSHWSSMNLFQAVQMRGCFWITASSRFLLSDIDANVLERSATVSPQRSQSQQKQSQTRREAAPGAAALAQACEDTGRNRGSPEHQQI